MPRNFDEIVLRLPKRRAGTNFIGRNAKYTDRKAHSLTYQDTFIDRVMENLKAGKIVVMTRMMLRRFQHRLASDKLPCHITIHSPESANRNRITIIPKKGLSFPPVTEYMLPHSFKNKNEY